MPREYVTALHGPSAVPDPHQVPRRASGRGLLPRIIDAAEQLDSEVTDLSVSEPTLETVFINLTGKELRE